MPPWGLVIRLTYILCSPLKSLFSSDPHLTLKAPDFDITPISANMVQHRSRDLSSVLDFKDQKVELMSEKLKDE